MPRPSAGHFAPAPLQELHSPEAGHGDQGEDQGEASQAQVQGLVDEHHALAPPGVKRLDHREEFIEADAAQHCPAEEDQGVQLAGGQAHRGGAGAPATHDKADAEDQAADDLGPINCGQKIQLVRADEPRSLKVSQTQHGRNEGAEHDLDHGHVLKIEHPGQLPGAAESGLLQGYPEENSDDQCGQKRPRGLQRAGAEKGLNHATAPGKIWPPHNRWQTGTP